MSKTIIITGASSGVGYMIALKLANEGHKVYATSKNLDKVFVPDELKNNLDFLKLDITKLLSVSSFQKTLLEKKEKIDVLINNAEKVVLGPFEDTPLFYAE